MKRTTIATMMLLGCVGATAQERPDLQPRAVRWQAYGSAVQRVVFERAGRPWFQCAGEAGSVARLKAQVEAAWPRVAPSVRGAWLLGFDRAHRLWLLTADRRTALAYHPERGWLEHSAAAGTAMVSPAEKATPGVERPMYAARDGRVFVGGRRGVQLLDTTGRWSYKPLFEANLAERRFHGTAATFTPLRFAEDSAGRVFVWSRWGTPVSGRSGTLGLFVHDARGWRHWRPDGGAQAEQLASVAPQAGGWTLICPAHYKAAAYRIQLDAAAVDHGPAVAAAQAALGDPSFAVREAASKRLLALGPAALPALRAALARAVEPEVRARLQRVIDRLVVRRAAPQIDGRVLRGALVLHTAAQGHSWLFVSTVTGPGKDAGRLWRISVDGRLTLAPKAAQAWHYPRVFVDRRGRLLLARRTRGAARIEGGRAVPLTDSTQAAFEQILGEDTRGRIFLSDGRRIAAVDPRHEDARPGLTTTLTPGRVAEGAVALDGRGRLWARLQAPFKTESGAFGTDPIPGLRPGQQVIQRWEGGRWVDGGLRGSVHALDHLVGLRGDGLLATPSMMFKSAYFDGRAWHSHDSIQALVDAHRVALVKGIVNGRRSGRTLGTRLAVDTAGRIWVARHKRVSARDAGGWSTADPWPDAILFLLPLASGRVLVTDQRLKSTLLTVAGGRIVKQPLEPVLARFSGGGHGTVPTGLLVDRAGVVRLPLDAGGHLALKGDPPGTRVAGGFPRLEDRAGNLWCLDPVGKRLTVAPPDGGAPVILAEDALHATTPIVQDATGRIWVGTSRGLLALTVGRVEGRLTVTRGTHYQKGVPSGPCQFAAVDAEHNLWFHEQAITNRLFRVALPK